MISVAEEWRQVKDYEGFYEVSSIGGVRSLDRVIEQSNRWGTVSRCHLRGKTIRTRPHPQGYRMVTMSREGQPCDKLVHVLVAEAFNGPCPAGMEVNHEDGDKTNNRPGNLTYTTRKGNIDHAVRTGLMDNSGERNGQATISDVTVLAVFEDLKVMGVADTARKHGLAKGQVSNIKTGKKWSKVTGVRYVKRRYDVGHKLSADDVRCVKAMPFKNSVMAKRLGVSTGLIEQIRYGKAWKHIQLKSPLEAA